MLSPFRALTLPALLLLSGGVIPLYAQIPSAPADPEVRRALPVTASDTGLAPIPERRAIPVTTCDTTAVAAPVASPLPVTPSQTITQPADPEGSIRIAPSSAGDSTAAIAAQFELAEKFFSRKQPELAVPEYEKFLVMSSKTSPGRERALFHLGESQRLMGSTVAAEASLQRLLDENPNSEFKTAVDFRLGELNESTGNLLIAADAFAQAATAAKDPTITQAAHFREAICREKSGQKDQANALLGALAKSTGTNAYRIPAQLHLGAEALSAGKKEEALTWYQSVLSSKPTGEIAAEAAFKSALIQTDLGHTEEAKKLFEMVTATKDVGAWQPVAALALLRLAAQAGDETGVLKVAGAAMAGSPDNAPEILLLQANAFRKLGKYNKALELYDTILKEYPTSKAATLAPFQRLLTLHATGADSLLTEIDQYLLTVSDPTDRAHAQLLKAEETLRRGKYQDAALLYHQIDTTSLPPSTKTEILYKEAWAITQTGDQEGALAALTRFLDAYPKDERAATALAQRALIKQQKKDLAGALADFTQLDQHYPKSAERELALQQKALLLGQQQDNKGMGEAFTLLLQDYPKSTAAPQAHYWLGWLAMENKDYSAAVKELSMARLGDPKQFGERAGLRILLADYYLGQATDATREAAALPPAMIPPEIGHWLGVKAMESGNPAAAERFLSPLVKDGLPGASDSDIQGTLASALIAQGKYKEAQMPAAACLKLSRDPASRAQALLVAASIQRSMKNFSEASALTDEAMLLQPEGSINAQARILSGDLLYARQDYSGAAKAYITVAVLSDDPIQAPKALSKAIDAYRRAGNLTEAEKTTAELQKRFPNAPLPPKAKISQ